MLLDSAECEYLLESALNKQNGGKTYCKLYDLPENGGLFLEFYKIAVNGICHEHTGGSAEDGAGIFKRRSRMSSIKLDELRENERECEESERDGKKRAEYPKVSIFALVCVLKEREKCKYEYSADEKRNADVKRGMYAEVHSRKCNENDHGDGGYPYPKCF